MVGRVLILTGPPGAGKTTVARLLTENAEYPAVHLTADDFWHFIRSGKIAPWLPESNAQNEVALSAVAYAAERYAAGGYFVVVDGIVGPWFLHVFRGIAVPLHYVILLPSLEESIDRCQRRGGDELSDPEPIASLHRQFSDQREYSQFVIHTEGLSAQVVCERVRSRLSKPLPTE